MIAKEAEIELTPGEKAAVDSQILSLGLRLDIDLTFEDVYMKERYSKIRSRSDILDVDFRTSLGRDFELSLPFISANMEPVTGLEMAVAMEREGALAIIPQTLGLETRLKLLTKIGRSDCALIDYPLTIRPERTLAEARQVMQKYNVNSLVVVNENKIPVGILSHRDWCHEKKESYEKLLVGNLMGGGRIHKLQYLRRGPIGPMFEQAAGILKEHRIEKLPLIDRYGHLAGLITARGLFYKDYHPLAMRDNKGRFLKIGSVGVGKHFTKERLHEVKAQVKKGIRALLIDTGRVFAINPEEAVKAVKKHFPHLFLIVGNTSTPEGAKAVFEWGADVVKVNQGRGSVCRTSENGVGTPQLTAIAQCSAIAKLYGKTVIADGGMYGHDHFLMAIAAGAHALMSGRMFVCADESAEPEHRSKDGSHMVKNYRGSASFEAQRARLERGEREQIRKAEGVQDEVPVKGPLKKVLREYLDGMRSSMSMFGARNLQEVRERVIFRRQSRAGRYEGVKKK